ncbi:MAG: 2-succinyl-6-hydroxy-2,4-cyclohexadiene-1-carboxylate synthase [Myxococcales bacterium]
MILALLHGFTGSGRSFDHLRERLDARFHVIAPDLPGHGTSPDATGWDDALDSLAKALGPSPLCLAGYSMGARLALAYALRFPDRVRALVLESGSPGIAGDDERAGRKFEDEALATFAEREGVEAFVARWEQHPTLASLRDLPEPLAATLHERRLRNRALGLASALRHLGAGAQPSLWEELPTLRAKTLLVAGERDPKFRAIAQSMARAIPDARLRLFARAGHAPHLESPDEYAEALLDHFTEA